MRGLVGGTIVRKISHPQMLELASVKTFADSGLPSEFQVELIFPAKLAWA